MKMDSHGGGRMGWVRQGSCLPNRNNYYEEKIINYFLLLSLHFPSEYK